MTEPLQTTDLSATPPAAASTAFVEKTPLERYVPPDKPSLVGLSRVQLAEALALRRQAIPARARGSQPITEAIARDHDLADDLAGA